MVDREQGREHRDEEAVIEDRVVSGETGPVSGEDAKAPNAEFLAALEKVMADHHNVLAALAK